MCAIAGWFCAEATPSAFGITHLKAMTDALAHRGPDGEGFHIEPHIAFGHRRLSIIDLDNGHQPLFNEDETVVVTFNGEIYNFVELTRELMDLGHVFKTRCDTEVIVHAWEQWGTDCVTRFSGMFAFALWDRNRRMLFAARDRFGVKPFYYTSPSERTLTFASELKALRTLPDFDTALDPSAVEEFFALGYVPDPKSIFASTRKLPPAHWLRWRVGDERPELRPYWGASFAPKRAVAASSALIEARGLLERSVASRLIADVPLGAFLSGGIDSSLVVALMTSATGSTVTTCSIGFDDPEVDESAFAREVATRFSTSHHTDQVGADDLGAYEPVIAQYDEPFADSSALPTWRVCQLARRHVKVALSGDGADEVFGGYRRYRLQLAEDRVRTLLPSRWSAPLFAGAAALYPKADWAPQWLRAKTTLQGISRTPVDSYFEAVSAIASGQREALYTEAFKRRLGGYRAVEVFRAHAVDFDGDEPLDLMQHLDLRTYLPGGINTKVDRASMAHSLEVREPMMDHRLAEMILRLPQALRATVFQGKVLLKQIGAGVLSPDTLRRRKQGFVVPLRRWFRGNLGSALQARLTSSDFACGEFIERREAIRMLSAHRSGQWDYSRPLWSILVMDAFLRRS